jgi:hypothetical protein
MADLLSHLALDGSWVSCSNQTFCASPVHVPMSIAEAGKLPGIFIETLAEAVDPPHGSWHGSGGGKAWYNSALSLQREFDLPALIQADGTRKWMRHGLEHRDHDRPAVVQGDGTRIWYRHGNRSRLDDKPALIRLNGSMEWWEHGKRLRREPEDG